ncbi:AT-rich interactive domain-containing protein 2 isoform X4 [Zootermopsis nevadensis]|uniref:AT-rich interactive domain-containing protein 2 isoform X4 n=1 Tax=Zootermopsis nevadensis TaxID=136037 RepID=UPI000B8E21B0|nr:AT-rich interactive domain-containing protein 2 isoform X4 [Zootermopsis nevadensis]
MAKILNKDPVTYQRERDGFIRDLKHFHETRGTPFRKVPQINGREIDLYLLYVLVTAHGGWVKVNSRNEWESLVEHFSLPKQCANCGVGLKQIYLRHLDRYEKVHYLGEDVERGSDDDEETRHRRWSARALHCVPLTYNHHQHNVADALRSYNGLSADLYRASDYDRLALSLVSPLPNEQDFALNVCTLLSNEGKHTLKLDKYPRLIDFLLAHAGVFNHSSTRDLFEEVYRNLRKHSLKHFWPDALADLDLCDLADETLFPTKKPKVKEVVCEADGNAGLAAANSISDRPSRSSSRCSDGLEIKTGSYSDIMEKMDMELLPGIVDGEREGMVDSATSMEVDVSDLFDDVCAEESVEGTETSRHEFYEEGEDGLLADVDANDKMSESRLKVPLKIEPSDLELFCLGRSFGTQDYVGQRVLQVATILRNLSFGEENVVTLARSGPFLRFLLLCAGSRWNSLHQLGLDMLGNVAHEVLMEDPGTDRLAACMLSSVSRGLHSQDRLVILSCLEVLNKLSQKDENEDIMLRYLDQHVYDQVCTFLTLHDIMLLIYTLECLYSLSSLGERACNCIVRVHGAIDTLVSLITVEAQSYGPKACILMRVVETVSGTQAGSTTTTNTTSTAMAAGTQNPNPPAPIVSTPVRPPAATTPQRQSTPQRVVIGAPQPAVATPVSLTTAQTPQQYQQQQHAHQQAAQENEQFALAWLRATFEPATGCRIEQAELYKQYLNACAKIGRRGVIAPLHFPRCVRSVFGGTIGPNPQKQPGGMAVSGSAEQPGTNSLMFYEGIKVRANPFSVPVSVSGTIQQPPSPQPVQQSPSPTMPVQRKGLNIVTKTVTPPPPTTSPAPQAISDSSASSGDASLPVAPAPASPILKAQLSAPPKQRETPKGDAKSQVLAHPHLTQALLGSSGGSPNSATGGKALPGSNKEVAGGGPPTSLIKSLLATKVNAAGSECMMPQPATVAASSMMPEACSTTTTTESTSTKQPPPAPQVTQRQQQQRLLQQQLQSQKMDSSSPPPLLPPSTSNSVQGKGVGNITSKSKPSAAAAAGVATTTTTTVKSPDPRQRVSRINGARTPLQVQSQTTPLQAQTQTQAQLEPLRDAAGENSSNGSCSMASSIITTATQCVVNPGVITQIPTRVITENHVPSPALAIGGGNLALRGRREPPQPPPPPLAPLSNSCLPSRLDVEDSDSTGNNSLASSSRDCSGICTGNISSTDDGDNSLTSFEGLLLNGIPHSLDIDAASNDSSSKDSARSSSQQQNPKPAGTKSLMLADLLEKKVDKKEPPILNGVLGKELRIGEKGLELVENHLEKVLKESSITQTKSVDVKETSKNVGGISDNCSESIGVVRTVGQVSNNLAGVPNNEKGNTAFKTVGIGTTDEPLMGNSVVAPNEQVKYGVMTQQTQTVQTLKRPAAESLGAEDGVSEAKRPHLSPESVMNGTSSPGPISAGIEQNPGPLSPGSTDKSTSSSASADNTEAVNASPSAANLYAALAASALEDEPELELPPPPPTQVLVQSASGLRQAVFLGQGVESGPQQQLIVTAAPRQIIVSQGQLAPQGQVLITAGGQLTLQQGPNAATATIKTPTGHQAVPVLVQTGGSAAQRTQISAVTHSQGAQLMQAGQVVLSQSSSGQFILSQAPAQGQVQLVQTSSGQGGQYIVSTSSSSGQAHYVVAQPQTALVQGQTQTVLVAQTPQQQGTGTKTIIILQPQSSSSATHHQKVVVTPQGQPVVVTQVPRPILQSPAISNPPSASIPPPALVPTSSAPPQPPLSPASPSLQPVKHVSTSTVATSTNTTPVHIPSRVASTGTSTSLPPAQPLTRAITPTNLSTTTLAPVSPSPVTATKTNAKPPTVHPTAVPAIPRPPLSPSPTALNSPRATPVQPPKQTRTLPNTRPQSSSTPVTETNSDKSTLQNTVRSSKPPCQPTPPQTRLMTAGSIVDQAIFLCEWRGCMRSFKSANEVYMHACEAHCPLGSEEIQCLWERCDAMKRKRFSLMTHLYDRHCNADVLRMMAVRRRQLSQSGRSEIPPPQPPPPHPGYAPNAAFHAIKRHALEFVNPKEMMRPTKPGPPATIPARTGPSPPEQDDNEGPVTKSIRLTSSLILRNLVIYSTNGKRFLRSYEPHLASVALSNVESSRTIAQVLYDMNQQTSQR